MLLQKQQLCQRCLVSCHTGDQCRRRRAHKTSAAVGLCRWLSHRTRLPRVISPSSSRCHSESSLATCELSSPHCTPYTGAFMSSSTCANLVLQHERNRTGKQCANLSLSLPSIPSAEATLAQRTARFHPEIGFCALAVRASFSVCFATSDSRLSSGMVQRRHKRFAMWSFKDFVIA